MGVERTELHVDTVKDHTMKSFLLTSALQAFLFSPISNQGTCTESILNVRTGIRHMVIGVQREPELETGNGQIV